MADITQNFKSTVKMVKVRNKSVNSIKSGFGDEVGGSTAESASANSKLPRPGSTSGSGGSDGAFSTDVRNIVANITGLRAFLLKNRKAYLAASRKEERFNLYLWENTVPGDCTCVNDIPLDDGQVKLSEAERDKIDNDAMQYMKLCKETLSKYKISALHTHLTPQNREHRTLVFSMVDEYLKVVCGLYSEQRAIRVRRAVDKQKLNSLKHLQEENSRKDQDSRYPPEKIYDNHEEGKLDSKRSTTSAHPANPKPSTSQPSASTKQSKPSTDLTVFDEFSMPEPDESHISTEEAQVFKEENEQLYSELNSTLDEVRQIEGKVVEISKLQEIFAEKVLEQDADINRISDEVVDSTENIVLGNEDIREAMKNNAGMRVWIIFGICVLTFALLFLDWYND